jgi:hypothetical protein
LHTGVVPLQSAFAVQRTHVPVVPLQTGVAPLHAVVFVGEHWPHAPVDWQAGVAPPHCALLEQPTQVCVPTLHTGVVPLQSAFAVQRTQVPLAVLQTGVAPPQAVAFPAEHWPHEPPG